MNRTDFVLGNQPKPEKKNACEGTNEHFHGHPNGIPVLHDSSGGSGWDFISGGKRVGYLYGSISI